MNEYTTYCTPEQTRKALELGAPINFNKVGEGLPSNYFISREKKGYYEIPTAEQLVGWLKKEKGFHFDIDDNTMCCIMPHINNEYICNPICSNSSEEATLAAIDEALRYLINNKK